MNRCMKTITLDDEAYARLKAWKRAKGDSFSTVVKRIVPEAGTLGSMELFVMRREAAEEKDAILQASIELSTSAGHDPWT